MQTTIKKTSETKTKRDKLPKDDAPKTQDDKLKKYNVSTPRNFLQKSSTADIYGQKKMGPVQSAKAPKKSPKGTNITNNVSPMKDLLKTSPSSTSLKSVNSSRDKTKMAVHNKATTHSATKVKDFNITVNSPVAKRRLNLDKEKSFIKEGSKREKDIQQVSSSRGESQQVTSSRGETQKLSSSRGDSLKVTSSRGETQKLSSSRGESQKVTSSRGETQKLSSSRGDSLKVSSSRGESQKISSMKGDVQKNTSKLRSERQRTKTRTLDENEVKILTPEVVDNNVEMLNLSQKLSAKPKAYFIDLEMDKAVQIEKQPRPKTPSDIEMSYEDDFESYESDFDSYHSSSPSEQHDSSDKSERENDDDEEDGSAEVELKEVKDEEKMLDSGSFDLRDQRSATKTKPLLDFILETAEGGEDKRSFMTDEGFQEMSSSSAVSSIRTVHVDVLDRPLFIDFTKSKENKRKKRINERLKERAKDLLSIITLHEMSYSLFEMKPISYDLYMATFGRSNYQQVAVQTFDDGVTEEVQTEEIECENKWTQHPVEFTKNDICINNIVDKRKYSKNIEDYLTKFTFLTTQTLDVQKNNELNLNENYKTDPLRIYFEQRDGVGPSEMLPYETYISKLKSNDYNTHRLSKFLKKNEGRIINILNSNSGNTDFSELKISKLPFSKGYVSISTKQFTDEKLSFLCKTSISQVYLSETKNNLIMTVHATAQNSATKKCAVCLWDISVATREPIKILTAIDNVTIARFRGATDGVFVAALEDGSIHLWDLSEEPTWTADMELEAKCEKLVEVNENDLTPFERDREWNKKNSHIGFDECNIQCPLQACAFTNSASNMNNGDPASYIVGLEFTGDLVVSREGRRVIGQVVALQRTGVLTIWSIIQEKSKTVPPDIGKAFWSKMKLEKSQTICLLEHIDIPMRDSQNRPDFNLNAAKRRLQNRKQEKSVLRINSARSKSSSDFDSDRPASAASLKNKKVLPVKKDFSRNWESGIVCYDLKVVLWRNSDNYLVAKNCGEVLCCKRTLGALKVSRFCITTDASSVTCIEVSPHKLPYYLAATDTGTISVCSLFEHRVLLTLDCRNIPTQEVEKCLTDHKGRFISSVTNRVNVGHDSRVGTIKLPISSLSWSRINPCCIFASLEGSIVSWELSHSDIYAKCAGGDAAIKCIAGDTTLALLTPDGEVHVHKLTNEQRTKEFLLLFEKYVALL